MMDAFGRTEMNLSVLAVLVAVITAIVCVPATFAVVGNSAVAKNARKNENRPSAVAAGPAAAEKARAEEAGNLKMGSKNLPGSTLELDARRNGLHDRIARLQAALDGAAGHGAGTNAAEEPAVAKTFDSLEEAIASVDWDELAALMARNPEMSIGDYRFLSDMGKHLPALVDMARRLGLKNVSDVFRNELVLARLVPGYLAEAGVALSPEQRAGLIQLAERTFAARQNLGNAELPGMEFALMDVSFRQGLNDICGKEGLGKVERSSDWRINQPAGYSGAEPFSTGVGIKRDDTKAAEGLADSIMSEIDFLDPSMARPVLDDAQKTLVKPILMDLAADLMKNADKPGSLETRTNAAKSYMRAFSSIMATVPMTNEQKKILRTANPGILPFFIEQK
jgi:hypothetical protein